MFPRNQYKDTITVFTPFANAITGDVRYYRRILTRCFWNADSVEVNRTGGTAAPEQVSINIPFMLNRGYVNRGVWVNASVPDIEVIWTIRVGKDLERSILIKGDVSYPALEQWGNSEAIGRALRDFRREFGTLEHMPSDVSEYLFGPRNMWRIAVSC